MGGGNWSEKDYCIYTKSVGRDLNIDGSFTAMSTQDAFKRRHIVERLNPLNVIRECCDSDEHPNTIPVILALDVTGSMGSAATKIAEQLNPIMTSLYESVTDVQFMIMGIGDLHYDDSPLQVTQFESDIRIAEQLDDIYFEGGGGGNWFESYTAAWYFGLYHTKLDCWKRNKKGIIITIGDERLNPYLAKDEIKDFIGDTLQDNIETKSLFKEAAQKFDIYHISVDDKRTSYFRDSTNIDNSWSDILGQNYLKSNIDNLKTTISDIIKATTNSDITTPSFVDNNINTDGISW